MTERFRRRRLPHWDLPGATYFVTTCLAGSIPAEGLLRLRQERQRIARQPRPRNVGSNDWRDRCWKKYFMLADNWLDHRPAVRYLADCRLASLVVDSIRHFASERYELIAYAVMPSHVHWVFQPLSGWCAQLPDGRAPREAIMHSLKRHTARNCNEVLGSRGTFWQDESYDHVVRSESELERIVRYVEYNPVTAGLVLRPGEWEFSSAYRGAGFQPANRELSVADLESAPPYLPTDRLQRLLEELRHAGFNLHDAVAAESKLSELRMMYEPFVNALAHRFLLALPPIVPEQPAPDNWQRSAWMKRTPGIGSLPIVSTGDGHFE